MKISELYPAEKIKQTDSIIINTKTSMGQYQTCQYPVKNLFQDLDLNYFSNLITLSNGLQGDDQLIVNVKVSNPYQQQQQQQHLYKYTANAFLQYLKSNISTLLFGTEYTDDNFYSQQPILIPVCSSNSLYNLYPDQFYKALQSAVQPLYIVPSEPSICRIIISNGQQINTITLQQLIDSVKEKVVEELGNT